jgi:predicted transcriptional regulator
MKSLTEVELELMTILWKLGEGSVNDVLAELPKERKLAYTSVSTMMRILEQKKVIASRKEGRGHVYFPKLKKTDYEVSSVKNLVSKVFEGAPVALVRQLLNTEKLSSDELNEIRRMLDSRNDGKGHL